jgi:hypothetical protein
VRGRLDRWDAAIVGYAVPAALCRPLTTPAAIAVAVPGAVLLVLAVRRAASPQEPVSRRHAAPWVGLLLLFGAWELTAVLWGNDAAHPTLSLLLDPALETYPGRLAAWLLWLAAGRWLVTR